MNVILKKMAHNLGNSLYPITDKELKDGLKNKTVELVSGTIYKYLDKVEPEYQTKDMTAKKKAAPKKKAKAEEEE
jgi:hypothetical protein